MRTNWGNDIQLSLPSSTPHSQRKKGSFLRIFMMKQWVLLPLLKSQSLSIHILNISCNKMRSTDKTLLLHTKFSRLNMHVIVWAVNWTSYFFHGKPFIPEKNDWQMNWLFRLEYLAGIFSKNEQSESVTSRETTDSIQCQW